MQDFWRRLDIDNQVVRRYLAEPSLPIRTLAADAQVPVGQVYRILARHGIRPNRRSDNSVQVRDYAAAGLKPDVVAGLTGYSVSTVRRILKNGRK